LITGGTNVNADKVKLSSKQTDLLIATPGRLLQHINETPITLKILKKVPDDVLLNAVN
jgi:superfamily II DNA/RNA helicase